MLLGSNLNREIWPESVWPWPWSGLEGTSVWCWCLPASQEEAGRRDKWETGRPSRRWQPEMLQGPNGPHQAGFCSVFLTGPGFFSTHSCSSPHRPAFTPISPPHCAFGDRDSICVMFPSLINTVHTQPPLSGFWKVNAPSRLFS